MHFPIFSIPLSFLLFAFLVAGLPLESIPCFPKPPSHCLSQTAPSSLALTAITSACAQIPTCPDDATPNAVKGKVPGYTATLSVGPLCGGVGNWSVEACVGLFVDVLDKGCKGPEQADGESFNCECAKEIVFVGGGS
ncbi:hypothetical protein EJ04DRAFT_585353 [Polyplosphaeria fusca]|uniref:Uncharacterized protein n=1 Tax=Polyplosphaeria fusca TaxID=682080 RepID=A0A9P4QSN7_9PLEO|nr:hypothetical protein EJ04DRAFT_585353 [Polyplosphaeria fusca]